MLKFVSVCEAAQYLVPRCVRSQRGGVSIWQVRPLRVCVCVCVCMRERLAKQRTTCKRASEPVRAKTGTTLFSSVSAMFPTIFLRRLL